jgi:hypothetical protein
MADAARKPKDAAARRRPDPSAANAAQPVQRTAPTWSAVPTTVSGAPAKAHQAQWWYGRPRTAGAATWARKREPRTREAAAGIGRSAPPLRPRRAHAPAPRRAVAATYAAPRPGKPPSAAAPPAAIVQQPAVGRISSYGRRT